MVILPLGSPANAIEARLRNGPIPSAGEIIAAHDGHPRLMLWAAESLRRIGEPALARELERLAEARGRGAPAPAPTSSVAATEEYIDGLPLGEGF